jgi:hypothetical protein
MKASIMFHKPFENLKLYNDNPDVALRRAIIMQIIIDACTTGKHSKNRIIEREAREWLFNNSDDFQQICDEADLEPDFVRAIARKIIDKLTAK